MYKLFVNENQSDIQALFSIEIQDGFVYFALAERKKFRSPKLFEGVIENIFSFVCKLSIDLGYNGFVSFQSKTNLIQFYKRKVDAIQIGKSQLMYIEPATARKLVNLYYEE